MTPINTTKKDWGAENLRTLSCRIRKEEAEKFKRFAEYRDTTTHKLLSEYVRKCLEAFDTVAPEIVENSNALAKENELLRRKLKVAEEAVKVSSERAARAEALVNKWLSSADEQPVRKAWSKNF